MHQHLGAFLLLLILSFNSSVWAISPQSQIQSNWFQIENRLNQFARQSPRVGEIDLKWVDWDHPLMFQRNRGLLGQVIERFDLPHDWCFFYVIRSRSDDELSLVIYKDYSYLPQQDGSLLLSEDPVDRDESLFSKIDFMAWKVPILKKGVVRHPKLKGFRYLVFPSINEMIVFEKRKNPQYPALVRLATSLGLKKGLIPVDLRVEWLLPEEHVSFSRSFRKEGSQLFINVLKPHSLPDLFNQLFEQSL